MNLIDAVIVLAVGLGVYIGWSRGLLGPLLAEATFLISYWVVLTHPGLVSSLTPAGVPRPLAMIGLPVVLALAVGVIGGMVLGAVFRIPLTRQLDKVLGAAVNGGVAFVIVYVLLLGLVGAGTVLGPITRAGLIGSSQVGVMRTLLSQYPQAAGVVPPGARQQPAGAAGLAAWLPHPGHRTAGDGTEDMTSRARRSEAWTRTEHHIRYGRQAWAIASNSPAVGGPARL